MDRADTASFGVSVAGHLLLFALMAFAVSRAGPPPVPPPMEVSYVEDVGLTSASPTQSPSEQGMAPEAGPTEDAAAAPEPARPVPAVRPQPAPQPAQRQAVPTPSRDRAAAPAAPQRPAPAPPHTGAGPTNSRSLIGDDRRKGIGRDPSPSRSQQAPAAMTGEARASLNAAIQRALMPCQRQPLPSPEAAAIKVDVRVSLNPDGSLAAANVLRVINNNPELAMYERRMQDLALAIVRRCTPIRGLPAQYYDVPRGWRQFTYQFDPRQAR
jgi:hypothetical protein